VNFVLLWIVALLVSLLWVLATVAWVSRVKRKWIRVALLFLVILVPLTLFGLFVFSTGVMKFGLKIEPNWFIYSVSLLLGYLVGSALILRQGARREPGLPSAAMTWKRMQLTLACLTAWAVGYMILLNADLAIRARCAILSVESHCVYLAALPAITADTQNAAPLYEKAFASLKDNQEEQRVQNPPTGNNGQFDPDEPATIRFLNHQDKTIALLRQAAALPACRFDQDLLGPDINMILPSLQDERNAAMVLNLHSREEIARGHAASAIADADAIIAMSRQFGRRPLLLSALVGMGIDAMGNETLEAALPAVKRQDELAALHLEEFPSMGRVFRQALRGEETFGLLLYGNMPATQMEMVKGNAVQVEDTRLLSSSAESEGAFFRVFFLDPDAYLSLMENLQNLSTQPYYKVRDQLPNTPGVKSGRGLFTSILIPQLSRTFETLARVEASDACAQTAVAMTRFRLDHGKLPSHLDELVPAYMEAVPIDPFDGHPLRLAIKSGQWIIYSIGPDGIDDGGADMVQGKGDVIFTLKPLSAKAITRP
jgi:hypothetical protein